MVWEKSINTRKKLTTNSALDLLRLFNVYGFYLLYSELFMLGVFTFLLLGILMAVAFEIPFLFIVGGIPMICCVVFWFYYITKQGEARKKIWEYEDKYEVCDIEDLIRRIA